MKKMLNLKLSVLTALIVFSSCEKIIDQQPQISLSAESAYTTRQGIEAGLLGCYNALQRTAYYGLEYWALSDMYAGIISHTGTFPTYAQFNNKQILPDNTNVTNIWNQIYSGINRVNTVINAAEKLNDPAFSKTQTIGEARFIRALMHFDVLRAFGGSATGFNKADGRGIPVRLSPTISPEDANAISLTPEADVWKLIDADLDYAIANLTAKVTGRATLNAAKALKARAALYKEDWATAETLSNDVINSLKGNGTGLSSSYDALWSTQNVTPESIFELQYDINNTNSMAFYYFPTGLGGRNEIGSSAALTAQSNSDLRRATNIKVLSGGNKTGKYSRINGTDNFIIIRLAELYLIRAEARARKAAPDLSGALADVNVIRNRAGLAASTAATSADILKQLYEERYFEFAHEGHAFFDYKRTNRLASTFTGFSGANAFRALYPTPQREVLNSAGLISQVSGY